MTDDKRPNPEKLLKRIQEERRVQSRGRLKIYLGAAAGVGKTYAMLEDALEKKSQGSDVVIGIVETHGRKDIAKLESSLEFIPQQEVRYHQHDLKEFDLDAALKRNPTLILIDEMAHTNAPGLRHAKRWQDIKEILDWGIHVYTTLNVQHIESLNDLVAQVLGIRVRETVPDSMLELADTIELIDLPPEDLLKRLQEGKVYFPQQAEIARENFFREGNLIALREMALRVTAQRVGAQVLLYRHGQDIERIWATKEKLLVCVGPDPASAMIIRAAKRIATNLQADWIALHVEAPRLHLSEDERNRAIENLRLAEQLGAETKILSALDIVKAIIDFAHEENVNQIIIGKRNTPRWQEWLTSNLVDNLVRRSHDIDIYMIHIESKTKKRYRFASLFFKKQISWNHYAITLGIVTLVTGVNFLLFPYLDVSNLIMIYLLGVTGVALLLARMGPSLFASLISVITCDFFFIPPYYSLAVANIHYFYTLAIMLLVSYVISHLTILARHQTEISHLTEKRTAALHTLSRQLASARGVDKLVHIGGRFLSELFGADVRGLLPENNQLQLKTVDTTAEKLDSKEQAVAQWVYALGQIAGLGTNTLPFSTSLYVPMIASQGPIGVLQIQPHQKKYFTPEQIHLLEACANQIGLAIEVDRLQEQMKRKELQHSTDQVRSTILQLVSHDLSTPLVSIMGHASSLMEANKSFNAESVREVGKEIAFEAEELSRLIHNLLEMTYLDAASVKLQKEFISLADVITAAISRFTQKMIQKEIQVTIPADLPKIAVDKSLLEEVFANLIDNAVRFTPAASPIKIIAVQAALTIQISVEDQGPGLMPGEMDKLFEKFYRGRMLTTERGIGLGLAICYSIIKAHGGKIWAENGANGGAAFKFTLPV